MNAKNEDFKLSQNSMGETEIAFLQAKPFNSYEILNAFLGLQIKKIRTLIVRSPENEDITSTFLQELFSHLITEKFLLSFEHLPDGKSMPRIVDIDDPEAINYLNMIGRLMMFSFKSNSKFPIGHIFSHSFFETLLMFNESELSHDILLDRFRILDLYEKLFQHYPEYCKDIPRIKHMLFSKVKIEGLDRESVLNDDYNRMQPYVFAIYNIAKGMNLSLPVEIKKINDNKKIRLFRWRDVKLLSATEVLAMIQSSLNKTVMLL